MPAPLARRPSTDVESIEQLVESARRYVEEGKAKSTRRAYRASFAGFDGWCTSRGLCSCPAPPATVAVYLAALADAGAAVSTIERALAGIAHEHRSRGIVWPRARARHPRDDGRDPPQARDGAGVKKAPVGDGELAALVATLGEDLVGLRDRALLTLGWSSACRRSELVALDVADVEVQREGLLVHVRRSKGDQEGKGFDKGIPYASAPALCAVRALARVARAPPAIKEGPIFRGVDRMGTCRRTASPIAQSRGSSSGAPSAAGLDPVTLRRALAALGLHDDGRREGPAARGDHAADAATRPSASRAATSSTRRSS